MHKCGLFEEVLSSDASEMDKLRNNGTKLDQKNIDSLISYCLNALGNKKTRLAAEYNFMGLLVMLCYRSDYIAHFYHEKDDSYVLEEVEDLLSVGNYGNKYL